MRNLLIIFTIVSLTWVIVSVFTGEEHKKINIKSINEVMEEAYSEGQKDAMKGEYKIKYDSINKTWYWIDSPWNDKTKPTFNLNQ